ncbi:1-acyl-sn-glycerol-3-phosphate acyltransferase [Gemmatimonas sp.]|uniref:1-acyl-sn-glycerol-3-phosphate acyltransferase n=1 Tax=Gemmatimonas sp. TaxID=1962908 RepID=UPI003562CBD1
MVTAPLPHFDSEHFSPLRAFLRWSSRRALRWVYRETTVVRLGVVPDTGPVLFIGNHPNDLPDVLLGLQACDRHVRYLATIAAGVGGAAGMGYVAMGVIPVTRVRDARKMRAMGVDMAAVNAEAGRRVAEAFACGDVVGVFPQGGVHDSPQIGRLRTGVAMMALKTLDNGSVFDVTVMPFGVQYEAARTLRTDAMVVVGRGWSLRGWRAERLAAGLEASVSALTDQLRTSLLGVTRNAPDWESAQERDEIVAAVSAVQPPATSASQAPLLERAARLVPIAESLVADHRSDGATPHAARVHTFVSELSQLVLEAGGVRTSARDHARVLTGAGLAAEARVKPIWALLLMTPAALIGWLTHAPIFWLVWRLAHRFAKARSDVIARACVPGLQVVAVWYLLLAVAAVFTLVATEHATWLTLVALVLLLTQLPTTADVAVAWRDGWRGHALVWRVRRWPASRRAEIVRVAAALREEWKSGYSHQ